MDNSCPRSKNNMIYFANPQEQFKSFKTEIEESISRVLKSNSYILGEEVNCLEKEFSSFIGTKFAVGVANGTDAIEISLRALDIGFEDEVITVSHTAVATVAAIEATGATPVLADIETDFYTIDTNNLESLFSDRTKAVIIVHLYGQCANIPAIKSFCKEKNISLIEDVSQAHGAYFKNLRLGTYGDISCFSCYPTKNLGAIGDAGLIATNNKKLFDKIKGIREYGWSEKRYISNYAGKNSRLDELQAAVLRVKLRNLDKLNNRRTEIAKRYTKFLEKFDSVKTPKIRKESSHVFHLYVIRLEERDHLINFLKSKNIFPGIHYPIPIHLQPAYANRLKISKNIKNTELVSKEILSLPIYPELSNEQLDYILNCLNLFFCRK